jgi:REP element-mobilizing transposase RayT
MERRAFNTRGEPVRGPNAGLQAAERVAMRFPPVTLDSGDRSLAASAIEGIASRGGWTVIASAVRTGHVHVVVSAETSPEPVMSALKAAATRGLREAGRVKAEQRIWSRHGSTRYLWDQHAVDNAVRYVSEGRTPPGNHERQQ